LGTGWNLEIRKQFNYAKQKGKAIINPVIEREFYHALDSDRKLIKNEICERPKSWSWYTAFDADSCSLDQQTCD